MIIDGKRIAAELLYRLEGLVKDAKTSLNSIPTLAVILVGEDPASKIYVRNKILKAEQVGIAIKNYSLPTNCSEAEIEQIVTKLNSDNDINGILIQLPLPKHLDSNRIINLISADKDVDGFTVQNVGMLNTWQNCLEPSTPQGCLILIKHALGENLSGKKAVVLGRSIIVGRPMASILIRESCSVTLLHSKSVNIEQECRNADIIISAIGKPGFVTAELIKPGACVIDVGITRQEDKVVGDVDFASVEKVAGFITPVPGGVGPMTVACMLSNTLKAFYLQRGLQWSN